MPSVHTTLTVAIGGALGALSRMGLTDVLGADPLNLATLAVTLGINTAGAAALALLYRFRHLAPEALVAGIGVGFLGSFTTWSAVIAAGWLLTGAGNLLLGLGYLAVTVTLGVAAAYLASGAQKETTA